MATRYIGGVFTAGPQLLNSSIVGAASGGTLAGSQKAQIVFDDAVFENTVEGKQRLLAAVELIRDRIASAKEWPISSVS